MEKTRFLGLINFLVHLRIDAQFRSSEGRIITRDYLKRKEPYIQSIGILLSLHDHAWN